MNVLTACMHATYMKCPLKLEGGARCPRAWATHGFKPLCGCCRPNPDNLQEKQVCLTAEQPYQAQSISFLILVWIE